MNLNEARKQLLSAYEFYLRTGDFQASALTIEEVLKIHPKSVDIFMSKFHNPDDSDDKEVLAQIILMAVHYPPAIDYLKNEMGWDDFTGYAGFPDS